MAGGQGRFQQTQSWLKMPTFFVGSDSAVVANNRRAVIAYIRQQVLVGDRVAQRSESTFFEKGLKLEMTSVAGKSLDFSNK